MPVASNIFNAAILAPLVVVLGALSLSTLQRSFEWISSIASNPQKGYLRKMRPYAKNLDVIIDRIMGGNKITVTTTHILLMAIAILLMCLLLEGSEKPKRVVVVDKKKDGKAPKSD
mmetsp:Transcript_31399/g.65056  ORF Transcript_31399/g.65056 Transcript_31399/m.65056 type:complete len:116 (+) Transcript_31399:117-464(+)